MFLFNVRVHRAAYISETENLLIERNLLIIKVFKKQHIILSTRVSGERSVVFVSLRSRLTSKISQLLPSSNDGVEILCHLQVCIVFLTPLVQFELVIQAVSK